MKPFAAFLLGKAALPPDRTRQCAEKYDRFTKSSAKRRLPSGAIEDGRALQPDIALRASGADHRAYQASRGLPDRAEALAPNASRRYFTTSFFSFTYAGDLSEFIDWHIFFQRAYARAELAFLHRCASVPTARHGETISSTSERMRASIHSSCARKHATFLLRTIERDHQAPPKQHLH
jgi:hypothetical protein